MIHIPLDAAHSWLDREYGIRTNQAIIAFDRPSLKKRVKYRFLRKCNAASTSKINLERGDKSILVPTSVISSVAFSDQGSQAILA